MCLKMASEKIIKILKKEFDDPAEAAKYAGKYILKRWTWGQKNTAIGKATNINLMTQMSTVDTGELQTETLSQCLISAPFDHTPQNPNVDMIYGLPAWLGDILIKYVRIINRELSVERQKNS